MREINLDWSVACINLCMFYIDTVDYDHSIIDWYMTLDLSWHSFDFIHGCQSCESSHQLIGWIRRLDYVWFYPALIILTSSRDFSDCNRISTYCWFLLHSYAAVHHSLLRFRLVVCEGLGLCCVYMLDATDIRVGAGLIFGWMFRHTSRYMSRGSIIWR